MLGSVRDTAGDSPSWAEEHRGEITSSSNSHMGKPRHAVAGTGLTFLTGSVSPRLCHEDEAATEEREGGWVQYMLRREPGDARRLQLWQGRPGGKAGDRANCYPVSP